MSFPIKPFNPSPAATAGFWHMFDPTPPITRALINNKPMHTSGSDFQPHSTISPQSTAGNNLGHYYADGSNTMFDGRPGAWLVKK